MRLDDQIDELGRQLAHARVATPVRPSDTMALDEVEAAIAPLRLPGSVRRLWERVDARQFRLATYPQFTEPEFALRAWQTDVAAGLVPARLFPLCYESWSYVLVELHALDECDGGTLFEWMYGGA